MSKQKRWLLSFLAGAVCMIIAFGFWLFFKPAPTQIQLENEKERTIYYQFQDSLTQLLPILPLNKEVQGNEFSFQTDDPPYLPAYSQNHWFRITNPDQREMTFLAELDLTVETDQPIWFAAKAKTAPSSAKQWKEARYDPRTHRWSAEFSPKELQHSGEIEVQVFRSINQNLYYLTSETFHITAPKLSAASIDGEKAKRGKFTVQLTAEAPSGMDEMNVTIWSKPDKSDLHTYEPASQHNQSYTYEFNYKYHDYHVGHFEVEAEGRTSNGLPLKQSIENPYTVEAPPLEVEEYEIKDLNGDQSVFLITAKLSTEENVAELLFPTWSEANGQDDLRWYKPKFDEKTSRWTQKVTVARHRGGNNILTQVIANVNGKERVVLHDSNFTVPETIFYYVQHRGNHADAPENSLPAFEQVTHRGVETDIQLTADGQWIVMHDDAVNRTTNGTGTISSLTLAQIRSLRLNQKPTEHYTAAQLVVPTLREFLQVCQQKELVPFIEIKVPYATAAQYDDLVRALQEYGLEQTATLISFHYEPLQQMNWRVPGIQTLLITEEVNPELISKMQILGGNSGLDVEYQSLSAELTEQIHQAGLSVGVWTVKSKNFLKMNDWHVEFVTTND